MITIFAPRASLNFLGFAANQPNWRINLHCMIVFGLVRLYKPVSDAFRQYVFFTRGYPMRAPVNPSLSPDTHTHTHRTSRPVLEFKKIHTILVQKQALFLIQLSYSFNRGSYTKIKHLT